MAPPMLRHDLSQLDEHVLTVTEAGGQVRRAVFYVPKRLRSPEPGEVTAPVASLEAGPAVAVARTEVFRSAVLEEPHAQPTPCGTDVKMNVKQGKRPRTLREHEGVMKASGWTALLAKAYPHLDADDLQDDVETCFYESSGALRDAGDRLALLLDVVLSCETLADCANPAFVDALPTFMTIASPITLEEYPIWGHEDKIAQCTKALFGCTPNEYRSRVKSDPTRSPRALPQPLAVLHVLSNADAVFNRIERVAFRPRPHTAAEYQDVLKAIATGKPIGLMGTAFRAFRGPQQ